MLSIPGFVSAAQASKKLGGISTQTLAKWARATPPIVEARQLPGGQFVYKEEDLDITKLCRPVAGGTDADGIAVPKVDGRKTTKKGK